MSIVSRFAAYLVAACLVVAMAATPTHAENLVLEPHTVQDPATVQRDAVTLLKPHGWKVSGGIKWYPQMAHQACLQVSVANPAGLEQVETLPWCYCSWFTRPVVPMKPGSNYMGNLVMQPLENPKECLRRLSLPQMRGKYNPRMTDYQEMPELAKVLSSLHAGAKVRSGRLRIEYALNGQMVEEDFYLSIFVTSANLGVNNCVSYIWGPAWTPFALRASKGQLDARTPMLLALVNSAKFNQRWFGEYMYVCSLFQDRMSKGIQNAVEISNTIRKNGDAIFKTYSDAYWKRQTTQDRLSQQFSDYIRGVQRWVNPGDGQPIQLPSGYNHVWASPSGNYILSNDPTFNPNDGSAQLKAAQ